MGGGSVRVNGAAELNKLIRLIGLTGLTELKG